MFLVHVTGKRPLVFISTIVSGLCFLGVATYARYLNLVPGYTVQNIVANVSHFDHGEVNILTDQNVTDALSNIIGSNRNLSEALHLGSKWEAPHNLSTTTEISFNNEFSAIAYRVKRNITDNVTFSGNLDKIIANLEERNGPLDNSDDGERNDLFIPIPEAGENQILWLPLTLLLVSALFAHMGIRLVPWMLIGEVSCRFPSPSPFN